MLQLGVKIFSVLAWVSLVVQVGVGLVVLVMGGDPVPIGGLDVPARLIGVLNCVGGAVYFFIFTLVAQVIRLLVEIREQVGSRSTA
jgi:hypothetical protein